MHCQGHHCYFNSLSIYISTMADAAFVLALYSVYSGWPFDLSKPNSRNDLLIQLKCLLQSCCSCTWCCKVGLWPHSNMILDLTRLEWRGQVMLHPPSATPPWYKVSWQLSHELCQTWCTATCRIRSNTTFEREIFSFPLTCGEKIEIMRSPLNVFTRRDKCNDTFKLKQYIWLTGHILSLYDSSDGAYNCFQSSPLWAVVVLPFLQQVLTAAEVGVFKEHPGPL